MSDYRAIAAVTQTLENLLLEAIREAVPGATVKTGPPQVRAPEEVGEGLINIFLFKVEPNKVWRNEELPVRTADGALVRQPMLALDLHYLLSFYGEERRKIPYLLLGLAMSALHAEPYPGIHHMPREAAGAVPGEAADSNLAASVLAGSGLEQQAHPLSFTLLPLDHDELVPLFSQIPFVMSVAYRASMLAIEPLGVPRPALPVRRADLYLSDARRPVLAAVEPQLLPYDAAARLTLRGEALASPSARVLFGDLESLPAAEPGGSLSVSLPVGIQAGTHLVRVAHSAAATGPSARRFALESNPVALVLEPVVREAVQIANPSRPPAAAETPGAGAPARPPVTLQVSFAPAVQASTALTLLLNERLPGSGRQPRSYALQGTADPRFPDSVAVEAEIEPGSYLVRIQIHGVTSRLRVDADPASPTFNRYDGPRVEIVG